MKYGESFTQLEAKEGRGISHGDIIDLNRENITGLDVREFYAELIQELKARGL
jgi:triacylglycerol lipase